MREPNDRQWEMTESSSNTAAWKGKWSSRGGCRKQLEDLCPCRFPKLSYTNPQLNPPSTGNSPASRQEDGRDDLHSSCQPTFAGLCEWLNCLFLFLPSQGKTRLSFSSSEATLLSHLIQNILNNLHLDTFNLSRKMTSIPFLDALRSFDKKLRQETPTDPLFNYFKMSLQKSYQLYSRLVSEFVY